MTNLKLCHGCAFYLEIKLSFLTEKITLLDATAETEGKMTVPSFMVWSSEYNGEIRSKLAVSIPDFSAGKANNFYKPFVCVEAERT